MKPRKGEIDPAYQRLYMGVRPQAGAGGPSSSLGGHKQPDGGSLGASRGGNTYSSTSSSYDGRYGSSAGGATGRDHWQRGSSGPDRHHERPLRSTGESYERERHHYSESSSNQRSGTSRDRRREEDDWRRRGDDERRERQDDRHYSSAAGRETRDRDRQDYGRSSRYDAYPDRVGSSSRERHEASRGAGDADRERSYRSSESRSRRSRSRSRSRDSHSGRSRAREDDAARDNMGHSRQRSRSRSGDRSGSRDRERQGRHSSNTADPGGSKSREETSSSSLTDGRHSKPLSSSEQGDASSTVAYPAPRRRWSDGSGRYDGEERALGPSSSSSSATGSAVEAVPRSHLQSTATEAGLGRGFDSVEVQRAKQLLAAASAAAMGRGDGSSSSSSSAAAAALAAAQAGLHSSNSASRNRVSENVEMQSQPPAHTEAEVRFLAERAAPVAAAAAPSAPSPTAAPHNPLIHGCRSISCYKALGKIDEGTYGVVYAAEDTATGERVAIKKVKMEQQAVNEGFPITALRESNVLLMLQHDNIVRVKEMVVGRTVDKVYMVMELLDHDLKALMASMKQGFTQAEVKCLMQQLLQGVACMHQHWIVHRDLKTSNLLMNNQGRLVICDFGLARKYGSPLHAYTDLVVTLWYRSPELLLGEGLYDGCAVDMWSAGCIMAELILRKPLWAGKTETEQLELIFKTMGTPTEQNWPGWTKLPRAMELRMRPRDPLPLRQVLGLSSSAGGAGLLMPLSGGGASFISEAGLDLLQGLLTLDPRQRLTAEEALAHPWFQESPPPQDRRLMPSFPSSISAAELQAKVVKTPEELKALHHQG